MIPYGHQHLDKNDITAVAKVLRSEWLTQGPKVLEFERKLAQYCGARYAVAVSSGTAALHLAYLAAGLKKGDEAITTPNTFVATTNMLVTVGAKPVFCDIRLDTYNINEQIIEKLITKKTRAIVPVHFAGQPCEMNKILALAKKYRLKVIEDACHALGAKYHGKKIGSLKSDMAVFSFHPVKSITTGEGGAIVTNNRDYYRKLVLLRSHGIYKDKAGKNVMVELGFNYRLTDITAALGISQLRKVNSFIKKRRQVVNWYRQALGNVGNIILPQEVKGNRSGWHIYVIRLNQSLWRDKLAEFLKQKGVGVNFHYPAVYCQPYYQKHGYKKVSLTNVEIYHKSCLTIPCYCDLKNDQVKFICRKVREYMEV